MFLNKAQIQLFKQYTERIKILFQEDIWKRPKYTHIKDYLIDIEKNK